VRGASLDCPQAKPTATGLGCDRAELRVSDDTGPSEALPLAIELDWMSEQSRLLVRSRALPPANLWAFAAHHGSLPKVEFDGGGIDLELELASGVQGDRLRFGASLEGLSFSDAKGQNAGEKLAARATLDLARAGAGWAATAEVAVDAGQIYLHPVFVDAGVHPVSINAEGAIDSESGRLRLSRVHARHGRLMVIDAAIGVDPNGDLEMLDIDLPKSPLGPIYRSYLQPFVIGSVLDALQVDGEVTAHLAWRPSPDGWRLRLALAGVDAGDASGRFGLTGVHGDVEWRDQGRAVASRIAWDEGRLYRIPFGAGVIEGHLGGRQFRLEHALELPLLGGTLEVDDLRVDDIGRSDLGWQFRGRMHPLQLTRLTDVLGWPAFSGTLAGDIPLVRYADGVIRVDGGLDVKVFDGRVRIDDLIIRDPFGVIPELRANVDLERLSLDALTGTFSFGNIQGRLQGRIHGLTLKDWKPTAFDARFATPEDDDSRHRISQRAVSNLASLGGTGEVLSSTFLRIFDEFSYRRLGIACRLEHGVCEMDGVAAAQTGYYIVEGGGLPPRIDVLGFNRRVDWAVLVERLRQMVASEGPVIR